MIKKEYPIKDFEEMSIVWETKRQKDILDILDEMLENAQKFGWFYIFADDNFYIEYTDGSTYEAGSCGEYGLIKKLRKMKNNIFRAISNQHGCSIKANCPLHDINAIWEVIMKEYIKYVRCSDCGRKIPVHHAYGINKKPYGYSCYRKRLVLIYKQWEDEKNAEYSAKCFAAMQIFEGKKSNSFHDSICKQWNECKKTYS